MDVELINQRIALSQISKVPKTQDVHGDKKMIDKDESQKDLSEEEITTSDMGLRPPEALQPNKSL